MKDVYDMLNDVNIDLDNFEDAPLSDIQIGKVNSRLKKRCAKEKKASQKTAIWVGRAAILVLGCMVFGGGVYAATQYRKNVKDDFRIKSEDAVVVSEEDNKVTMEIHDDVTGGSATFNVESEGKAKAKIVNISSDGPNVKVGVELEFNDDVDLTELQNSIEEVSGYGVGGSWSTITNSNRINLKAFLDGREVECWGNESRFDGQKLYLDLFMGNMFEDNIKALEEYNESNGNEPLTVNSTQEEIDAHFAEIEQFLEAPDYASGTIQIDLEFPEELGGMYSFTTDIDDYIVDEDKEIISIDPIVGESDMYGDKQKMTVDSYSIGATGFQVYGTFDCNWFDPSIKEYWENFSAECEKAGVEVSIDLDVVAWDDLGNKYLLIQCGSPDGTSDRYVAPLYDNATGLKQFSLDDGVDYKSEWDDNMTQLSFAVQRRVWIKDSSGNETKTCELVSDTRTIDIPQN